MAGGAAGGAGGTAIGDMFTPGDDATASTPPLNLATSPRSARTSARTLNEFHSNSTTTTITSNTSAVPKNAATT